MVDAVSVIDDHGISSMIIAAMISGAMVVVIAAIDAYGHHGGKTKPGWVVSVIIWRGIRYVSWGVNILHNWC